MTHGALDQDPLVIFLAPPPNETPQERVLREANEVEAKRISDQIDEQLQADRVALKKQKSFVRILLLGQAESVKFFLNDFGYIASRNYDPADDGEAHAHLKTLGVKEYKFEFAPNISSDDIQLPEEWRLYHVIGSRTMRHTWLSHFDTVQAIIFFVPVSCFDQTLSEDPSVNCLKDSLRLWKTICASIHVPTTRNMILIFSKVDLLDQKLRSGLKFNQYVPSYGERDNDMKTVVQYLKSKFKEISYPDSTKERHIHYLMNTTDTTKSIASIILAIRDCILRGHIKEADFI